MKFTKKSILAILLVCVCMMGCFVHSYVNADDTAQPLATPAIEEPVGEIIDAEEPTESSNIEETVELVDPVYLDMCVNPAWALKRYVSVNSYGQKLVKLEFDFADSENYGTEYIRKLLSDLLGDIKDEQYVSDEVFYDLTNITRGDKVLLLDKHPLSIVSDVNSPYDYVDSDGTHHWFVASYVQIAMEFGDIPNLEEIYVKQDLEVLYLSEEQYEKVLSSGLCRGSICYADYDYIYERDHGDFPNIKLPPVVFNGLFDTTEVYEMKVEAYKERYHSDENQTSGINPYTKMYNEKIAPYIVE